MAWFVIALMMPMVAGYALVALCDGGGCGGASARWLRAGLAVGLGLGLASCGYFVWLLLIGRPAAIYQGCELALYGVAALVGLGFAWNRWLARKASASQGIVNPLVGQESGLTSGRQECLPHCVGGDTREARRWSRLLAMGFCVAGAFAILGAIGDYWREPLGGWDAWMTWNQRARGIFLGGEEWRQAFSSAYVHTDYPLLTPSGNARLWTYLGAAEGWVPWLFGVLFTFGTVAVLAGGVGRLRSRCQGLLAGLALLGMAVFVQRGASQYADVPLAFFVLAAVLLIALHDAEERRGGGLVVLSGMAAGLAAWTKNEGMLLLLALPAARVLVTWRSRGMGRVARELACWGLGVAPILAVIAIQKGFLAADNDLVGGQGWHATLGRVASPWRYWATVRGMATHVLQTARPLAIVLPLCILLMGPAKNRGSLALGLRTAGCVFVLMLGGYFVVYITTPADLEWHIATSAERLLLHVWPLGLLTLFLYLATPEELLAARAATAEREETAADGSVSMIMRVSEGAPRESLASASRGSDELWAKKSA